MEDNKRKSKKEREKDLRDDGFKKRSLIDYNAILDKPAEDKRFERERSVREQELSSSSSSKPSAATSTFDAFKRMAAGLEGRTLADKMADPNRPTWEQYKKDNEDKLDMVGGEAKKMVEYRAELDKERDRKLKEGGAGKQSHAIEDSDEDESNNSEEKDRSHKHSKSKKEKHKKKSKKKEKSEKKGKKLKKEKKSKRSSSSADAGAEDLKESKKRKSSSSSSESSNSDRDDSSGDEDDDAPRSIITGKKIKMNREMTYEDRLQEIDRAAKRHFMNTQY